MTKEQIIKKIVNYIMMKADELNLTVKDNGTGNAFKYTFWQGLIKDYSNIPNIVAQNDDYNFELRSFWGSPELCIHKYYYDDKGFKHYDLQILTYNDSKWEGNDLIHTNNYYVDQVRVNCKGNYKEYIDEIYDIIDWIESK